MREDFNVADYGMKVSEVGYDVKTAADKNLILKTGMNLLKVVASGSVSINSAVEITHNLGYVPQFLVFWNDVANGKTYLCTGHKTWVVARADTTKLYISGSTGDTAYYYIFYEQA